MVRSVLRKGLRGLVKVFPRTARRVADFSLRELGGKASRSARKALDLEAKVERQARQIEKQKSALRDRDERISAYKDKVDFYKHKLEAHKKKLEGPTRALSTRPESVTGNGRQPADVQNAAPRRFDFADFQEIGFFGPFGVFAPAQCRLIANHLRETPRIKPAEWSKGKAVTDHFWYELATQPALLNVLKQVLGDNVILWGARLVRREPGQAHPWHTDIESSCADGGFASVWIGLENTCAQTGLQLVTRSHALGKTIQQIAQEHGASRGSASPETVLAWAQEIDPSAELTQPEIGDGEAIVFDGRLWHGSYNSLQSETRSALLLQYARADRPVRLTDPKQLEWPFRFLPDPLPPVIAVAGEGNGALNRVVPAPRPSGKTASALVSGIHPMPLPLEEDTDRGWRPHHIFRGTTQNLDHVTCHMSILSAGKSPHLPHAHAEEELLIVLDGEADLIVSEGARLDGATAKRARRGDLIYYAPYQHHTIHNPSAAPVTYLMLKWRAGATDAVPSAQLFHYDLTPKTAKPRWSDSLFKLATPSLSRFASHVTVLQPGAGYEPHADSYDVAILLLEGEVETLGRRVIATSFVYHGAGELHGMWNVGVAPACYLVFELQAASPAELLGQPVTAERARSRARVS